MLKKQKSAFSTLLFQCKRVIQGTAIKSVPEEILQFCFQLEQADHDAILINSLVSIAYLSHIFVPAKKCESWNNRQTM